MAEVTDQLLILNDAAQGYLARASFHRINLSSLAFSPTVAQSSFDKIRKIIIKKWPEVQSENIDKDKNYQDFVTQSAVIITELEDVYNTFVLIHDWLLKSHAVLNVVLNEMTSIDTSTAHFSFVQILTLISNHIKLIMMLHDSVVPLKMVTCMYSHACLAASDMREKLAYKFLSKLLSSLSLTVSVHLAQDFKTVAPHVARMLLSIRPIHQNLSNLHSLDSSGTLDVMHDIRTMAAPSIKHEVTHRQSMMYGNYREWVVLGYLTCPHVLVEEQHFQWLQCMLRDGWVLHVCRDVLVVSTHSLWVEMFGWYPKKKSGIKFPKGIKPKKIVQTCEIESVETCFNVHAERRRFCARVLNRLCTACAHTPGLVAPRCMTLLTALSLTRGEVVWYYQHVGRSSMLSSKKLIKRWSAHGDRDLNISTLMHLMCKLTTCIRHHRVLVGRYYHEYLQSTHCDMLLHLLDGADFNDHEDLRPLVKRLSSLSSSTYDHVSTVDFRSVRMAWWRHETKRLFSGVNSGSGSGGSNGGSNGGSSGGSSGSGEQSGQGRREGLVYQRAVVGQLSQVVERIVMHTTWLDDLESTLSTCADLSPLWWCRAAVGLEYAACLSSPSDKSGHVMSFVHVWKAVASNVTHRFYPEDTAAKDAEKTALDYLQQASMAVVACFRPLFNDVQYMSDQTSFRAAAVHLHARALRKKQEDTLKQSSTSVVLNGPGTESRLPYPTNSRTNEAQQRVLSLLRTETIAKNICNAMTSTRETYELGSHEDGEAGGDVGVQIYRTVYYPSVILREQLRKLVAQSVRTVSTGASTGTTGTEDGGSNILRPTALLRRIKHVMVTLHRIATTSFTHDVERIVREELLRNCWDSRYAPGVMGEATHHIDRDHKRRSSDERSHDVQGGSNRLTDANSMVHCYGRKYIHLIESLLTNHDDNKQYTGIVWSDFKQGFIRVHETEIVGLALTSSTSSDLLRHQSNVPHVEHYATLTELMALCQLIGPQGMRCIEHSMYHLIAGHATTVRAFLSTNRSRLEKIRTIMTTSQATSQSTTNPSSDAINSSNMMQQSMDLEMTSDVIRSSICMGHALKMRELISEAIKRTLIQKIPRIHETVSAAYNQYDVNVELDNKHVPMDRLARECGLNVGAADHALIDCMKHLRSDKDDDQLWSLLPYAFGAVLTSNYWIADRRVRVLSYLFIFTTNQNFERVRRQCIV